MNKMTTLPKLVACLMFAATTLTAPAAEDPGAEGLEKFFETVRKATISGNTAELVRLARGAVPDRKSLETALSDHVPSASIDKLEEKFRAVRTVSDQEVARIFAISEAERIITVHAATVRDLIENAKESAAYQFFPRELHAFAHDGTLRDDSTYYEVSVSEPGKTPRRIGILFWDGGAWKMLGSIWKVLEAEDPLPTPPLGEPATVQREHLALLEKRLGEYQATRAIAENDLAEAMAVVGKGSHAEGELEAAMNRALVSSKLVLAMQSKIPRLEERIRKRKLTVNFMEFDLGFSPEVMAKVREAIEAQRVSPEMKLAAAKKELGHLESSKKAIAKQLENPAALSKEELVRLIGELTEVDKFIEAKESEITTLEKAAISPAPDGK